MPKYLFRASYTASGAAGVLKEGGSARQAVVTKLVESAGGTVESVYWALGPDDFFMIADLPDVEAVAVLSLTVGSSGAVGVSSVELLTAAQVDAAAKRRAEYRAPGA
jgi:uncharacterized protein with GYD domain